MSTKTHLIVFLMLGLVLGSLSITIQQVVQAQTRNSHKVQGDEYPPAEAQFCNSFITRSDQINGAVAFVTAQGCNNVTLIPIGGGTDYYLVYGVNVNLGT